MSDAHSIEFSKELKSHKTPITGLIVYDLPVHGDNRGWFKENWQREKMTAIGLPDFGPVQNNVSFNAEKGVTRGLHAEPWDKFVSIGSGSVYGAWCDIREGSPTYGKTFTTMLDPSKAIYIPRGIANGFQATENNTVYMYLVNDHWSAEAQYSNVSIFDESLELNWPIPLDQAIVSDKDKNHPELADASPIKAKKTLIIGAYGQLGQALAKEFPDAEKVDRDTFDMSDPAIISSRNWKEYELILNAAAYTAVDLAETEGRADAWLSNATALTNLVKIASENSVLLVHVSTDYVFDGTKNNHKENENLSPLGVYGQTKAAGDLVVSLAPRHYIARTSWVIGDGNNFVRTMKSLAERGVQPSVVDDQIGRLTFTSDLAKGIKHLVISSAPYGTYNITNEGKSVSWADIAKDVYEYLGKSRDNVTPVATEEYYQGKEGIAPRPLLSTLDLTKIKATGFSPRNWEDALRDYLVK